MPNTEKKPFWKSVKAHEATIVEVAAVLTSAPRWIIAFSPVDRADLDKIIKNLGGVWDWASAVLSISFAVVEIWATMMVMRAFHKAKGGERIALGVAWVASLVVLAVAQIPALYASLTGVKVPELEGAWPVLYIVAMSIAAFTVVAGVSYADRFKDKDDTEDEEMEDENVWDDVTHTPELPANDLNKRIDMFLDAHLPQNEALTESVGTSPQLPTEPMHGQTPRPDLVETKPEDAKMYTATPDSRIVVHGYEDFKNKMLELGDNAPRIGAQVERMFHLSRKTSYGYWNKYVGEKS